MDLCLSLRKGKTTLICMTRKHQSQSLHSLMTAQFRESLSSSWCLWSGLWNVTLTNYQLKALIQHTGRIGGTLRLEILVLCPNWSVSKIKCDMRQITTKHNPSLRAEIMHLMISFTNTLRVNSILKVVVSVSLNSSETDSPSLALGLEGKIKVLDSSQNFKAFTWVKIARGPSTEGDSWRPNYSQQHPLVWLVSPFPRRSV